MFQLRRIRAVPVSVLPSGCGRDRRAGRNTSMGDQQNSRIGSNDSDEDCLRNLASAKQVVHVLADCLDCGWKTDDYLKGIKKVIAHANDRRHKVSWDVGLSGVYWTPKRPASRRRPKRRRATVTVQKKGDHAEIGINRPKGCAPTNLERRLLDAYTSREYVTLGEVDKILDGRSWHVKSYEYFMEDGWNMSFVVWPGQSISKD